MSLLLLHPTPTSPAPAPASLPRGRACDCSNYTGILTVQDVQSLKDAGIVHVIVRASLETVKSQRTIAQQQMAMLTKCGVGWSAYLWAYWNESPVDVVNATIDLIAPYRDGYAGNIIWIDAEDNPRGVDATAWLYLAGEQIRVRGMVAGLYTSDWWVEAFKVDLAPLSTPRGLWPLWQADYTGTPGNYKPLAPWPKATIHQYAGDSIVGSVREVDLDVVL